MRHDLKGLVKSRRPLIGTFAAIPHPSTVEIVAAAGVDFLCIDGEHSQIGRGLYEDMIRAADLHQVPAMVRVPGHAPESFASVLDAGAAGVLVPRVGTVEEARAAVAGVRFPPLGRRGVGPGRAAGYGYRIGELIADANSKILLALQIETADGLANIDAIAAVEGIDLLFIGPGDLSVSIGALGPEGKPRLDAAIGTIIDAAGRAGVPVGIFRPNRNDVGAFAARGVSLFIIGSDAMMLGDAARHLRG